MTVRELPLKKPGGFGILVSGLRRSRSRKAGVSTLCVIVTAITAVLVVPPLLRIFFGAFQLNLPNGGLGGFTISNFVELTTDPRLLESLLNSFVFAAGSALLALVFGGAQAWIVERTDAAFKSLAFIGAVISLATPFILYVAAFTLLFGRAGPVNDLLKWLFGTSTPPLNVASMWGMILIEGTLWIPLVYMMLAPVFRAANPVLEEAALASGASLGMTLWRISFRLAAPGTLAVLLLMFVRGIEAFEVPAVVGMPGGVNVLTTNIYLHLKMQMPPNLGRASAFSVVLILLVCGLLYAYQRMLKRSERYAVITGNSYRPRTLKLGRLRPVAQALLLLNFTICVVLPGLILVWASLLPFYQSFSRRALGQLTFAAYGTIARGADVSAMINTLLMAAATATATMALSALAGWLIGRSARGASLLDQLGAIPLIFPGIVLAVAMIQLFASFPIPIYGTLGILILAFTIRYVPYGFRYATAGTVQVHAELEQAASASGASRLTVFRRILAPLIGSALGFGWLFIFLLAARDLSMPILLAGPSARVVALTLYDYWIDGRTAELAALGLAWTILMTVVVAVMYRVLGLRRLGTVGS